MSGPHPQPMSLDAWLTTSVAEAPTPYASSENGVSPKTALKTLRTVNSCAPYDPKRKNPIAHVSSWAATGSTTPVTTPTTDMLAAKILFNSVISTATACFMTMDISNFYLNTPLKRPEYIRMKITDIPEEIITKYKLRDLVEPDDCV
eukprot:CCRYP_018345-RA/>CCRYP_018345-RA protein AED:0.46 eAED:0.46 QI:0/0/0/1/0/0/3/0/146